MHILNNPSVWYIPLYTTYDKTEKSRHSTMWKPENRFGCHDQQERPS